MAKLITIIGTGHKSNSMSVTMGNYINKYMCERFSFDCNDMYVLADYNITYCNGCSSCFQLGNCPLDKTDDMPLLRDAVIMADVITVVVPVYGNNIPGIMKSFLDRIISWTHILRLAGKKVIIYVVTQQSGATYVCNYIANVFSLLGAKIIAYGNLTLIDAMAHELCIDEILRKTAHEFVHSVDMNEYHNKKQHELHFANLKKQVKAAEKSGKSSFEINYWIENGLIEHQTFDEYSKCVLEI